jgi:thioredoxin reductase
MKRAPANSPGEGQSRTECDVLVAGSGAGALSAAVTAAFHGLKVIVAEKDPLAQRAGIAEDVEAPRTTSATSSVITSTNPG